MPAAGTLQYYMDRLQTHFHKVLTPEWGEKAVKHVYATVLPKIIEAGGRYPPKKYR
jgi:hypothetical protein